MDTQDNVIYIGSFWQLLYPLTTICHAIFPQPIVELVRQIKQHTVSLPEGSQQLALCSTLNDGYLMKHARRIEREFAARRRCCIYEVKKVFQVSARPSPYSCGLTLMIRFEGFTDDQLLAAARLTKLPLISTEPLYNDTENRKQGECLLYFPAVDELSLRGHIHSFSSILKA